MLGWIGIFLVVIAILSNYNQSEKTRVSVHHNGGARQSVEWGHPPSEVFAGMFNELSISKNTGYRMGDYPPEIFI